jgi:hypothetical protein
MRRVVFRNTTFPLGGSKRGGLKGIVYVCPTCGEAWGKLELADSGSYMVACNSPCDLHGDDWHIGGSFLMPLVWWDHTGPKTVRGTLPDLSPEFLRHEALMKAEAILSKGYCK